MHVHVCRCCVDLISIPVECDTLHAILRLCLRCTRSHKMAELFVSYGGVDALLALMQESAFTGFTSICTLLFRHILEDEATLRYAMEKVSISNALLIYSSPCSNSPSTRPDRITDSYVVDLQVVREVAAGVGSNFCGVSASATGCREINYVMRQLGPAMCRNPRLLRSTAEDLLKITLQNGKGKLLPRLPLPRLPLPRLPLPRLPLPRLLSV